MNLPDIEIVSADVHAAWMASKRAQGVTTRKAEDGEELMVPYDMLTDKASVAYFATYKSMDPSTAGIVNDPSCSN